MGVRVALLWLCLLALPVFELTRHFSIRNAVPQTADYRAAANFIRGQLAPRDLISAAPFFIDPILREQLGDRMPLAMAGRSDLAAFERLWVLSIRGALPPETPHAQPELTRQFGGVRVLRYALGPSPVLFDFAPHFREATATLQQNGEVGACPLRKGGVARGGGLGKGVLIPIAERFECDARRPWLFMGPVVMEDLHNQPRYCIWQHPAGDEPNLLRFHDVPLGDELVFYGGLYYENERMREGAPVIATVWIDGKPSAQQVHRDGEGWKRLRIATPGRAGTRGEVAVGVQTPESARRGYCWSLSSRTKSERTP